MSFTGRGRPYQPAEGLKHDEACKRQLELIIPTLLGARYLRENLKEQDGTYAEGFWDQEYILPPPDILGDYLQRLPVEFRELFLNLPATFRVEGERKNSKWFGLGHIRPWNQIAFEYSTVHITARKWKNTSDIFTVNSFADDFAFLLGGEVVRSHPIISKRCYDSAQGRYVIDHFFEVPVDRALFIAKDSGGNWLPWTCPSQLQYA